MPAPTHRTPPRGAAPRVMRRALAAALASIGSLVGSAHAEIIRFTNPEPSQPGHFDWTADPYNGMFLDMTVSAADQSNVWNGTSIGQGIGGDQFTAYGILLGSDAAVAVTSADEGLVLPLTYGEPLGGLDYSGYTWFAWGSASNPGSPFPEGERRYVGVRIQGGRFGWIEVERTGLSLAAFNWAYETEPGVAIDAGQVSAPGSLALLAIVATASSWGRRRA